MNFDRAVLGFAMSTLYYPTKRRSSCGASFNLFGMPNCYQNHLTNKDTLTKCQNMHSKVLITTINNLFKVFSCDVIDLEYLFEQISIYSSVLKKSLTIFCAVHNNIFKFGFKWFIKRNMNFSFPLKKINPFRFN